MSNLRLDIQLTTKEGRALLRKFDRQGDPEGMETYYSEDGCAEIVCSTAEREECEAAGPHTCDSDTLSAEDFAAFANWLEENAGLKLGRVGTQG